MSSFTAAYERIISVIREDQTVMTAVEGRIFEGVAPLDAPHPLILIQPYSSEDVISVGQDRAAASVQVMVRVVSTGAPSLSSIEPIYDAIDRALIHSRPVTSGRGTANSISRVRETEFAEYTSAGPVRYLGGLYSLLVS